MSVEFQLVGNLTLRQFAYLGVGGVLAFAFFVLPIYGFIKWPMIILLASFFGSLAFLPINDIGLDRWIIAFFKAVNSPTKRIWIRNPKELPIFAQDYAKRFLHQNEAPAPTADRSKLNAYLASTRTPESKSELDVAEESYINTLPFEAVGAPPPPKPQELAVPIPTTPTIKPLQEANTLEQKRTVEEDLTKEPESYIPPATTPTKPVITVHTPEKNIYVKKVSTTTVNRVLHSLSSLQGVIVMPVRGEKNFEPSQQLRELLNPASPNQVDVSPPTSLPPAPPPTATPPPAPPSLRTSPSYMESLKIPAATQVPQNVTASPTSVPPPINFDQKLAMETKLAEEAEAARQKLAQGNPSSSSNLMFAAPPAPQPIKIETPPPTTLPPPKQEAPLPEVTTSPLPPPPTKETRPEQIPSLNQPIPQETPKPTIKAIPAIGKMAPLPATVPNVIVGLVRAPDGLLLTDVVIVVKDPSGEPVRALKSNKVGQFAITTPLPNGQYLIELKKESYQFDTIEVTLDGQIFQPIEIRAQ